MHITRQQLGEYLKKLIIEKATIDNIAFWAHSLYLDVEYGQDDILDNIIYSLMMMDAGPEFEYTYEELNDIADRLIAGEDVKL